MVYNHLMAKGMFDLDINFKELRKMEKKFKFKNPRNAVDAMRATINDQAFGTMNKAKKETLPRVFNIRNKWIQSSIQVVKAKKTGNAATLEAIAGAKSKWSRNNGKPFMGMRDQEFGKTFRDNDIPTLKSRIGGSFARRISSRNKANKLGDVQRSSNFPGNSRENKVIAMFRTLEKRNYKGFMFVRKHKKLKRGIYKFVPGFWLGDDGKRHKNIVRIRNLSNKIVRIPARPWLSVSTRKAVTKTTTTRQWRRNAKRLAAKIK